MNIWTTNNYIFEVGGVYHYGLKLTIDSSKIDEDLTDFPINITLSSGTGMNTYDASFIFDEVGYSNRKKIYARDTNDNGLYVEIERWDQINREANLWVKVPEISSSVDTDIYLFYDTTTTNSGYVGDTTELPAQNVWDSNYVGVWHMSQDPLVTTIKDSTSSGTHGTMPIVDATNIALGKTAYVWEGGDDASKIFDGNMGTYAYGWKAVDAGVKVDLGQDYGIAEMRIYKRFGNRPENYYIQTADDWDFTINVQNIITGSSESSTTKIYDTSDFGSVTTRYLQIISTANWVDLYEWEVYTFLEGDFLVDGKVGEAVDFIELNNLVIGSPVVLDDVGTITIESIFKPEGWGEGNAGRIISKATGANANGWSLLTQSTRNTFVFLQGWSSAVGQWETPNPSISLDNWYHGVVRYDRSYGTSTKPAMYLNGISQTVTTQQTPAGSIESDAAQDVVVGSRAEVDRYFDGIIDEVRISDVHRSSAWIKATYYSNWNDLITFGSINKTGMPASGYEYGSVNIYDLSATLSGIVSSEFPVSSVWANNDYLYLGTTVSGIIRTPISSISGAVFNNLSYYKRGVDLTDDQTVYIHGTGNYLLATTVAGVDQFDLTTDNRIYTTTLSGATKCFQTTTSGFYYVQSGVLNRMYDDGSTFSYSPGAGIIPSNVSVNDIHVNEFANNIIFVATTSGAVVVEEDKGNESNCRFKYYYTEV